MPAPLHEPLERRQPAVDRTRANRDGAAAEALAAFYLEAHGLSVVARNLRCRAGELDLVCLDDDLLVIVEVRRRSGPDFGGAAASVTWRKRCKLLRATRFYWQSRPAWRKRRIRFDVLAVQGRNGDLSIAWIKDAFRSA